MQPENTKRTSIGAWKKQTPKGEVINFSINGQRYNMWFNSKKTQEKQPDFNIYEDNYVKPENPTAGYAIQPGQQAVQAQYAQPQVQQQPQYAQPQVQQPQVQQPQQGFVPANNGLNF